MNKAHKENLTRLINETKYRLGLLEAQREYAYLENYPRQLIEDAMAELRRDLEFYRMESQVIFKEVL